VGGRGGREGHGRLLRAMLVEVREVNE
jgi:hypothetical protein